MQKLIYYTAHRLIGSSLGQVYEQYLREDQGGVPADRVHQLLVQLFQHCEAHVPYYAKLMNDIAVDYTKDPFRYLAQLPVLTKEYIRQNFTQLTSDDLAQRRWIYNTSGGSTGEPIRLIQDRAYLDRQTAIQLLSFTWAGRAFGEPAVRIWGSERDILQGTMGWKMKTLNRLTNDQYLNAFRMTPEKMRAFIKLLNRERPKLIIAYTQAMYELAKFAEAEDLPVAPQQAIVTSAGTLYPFIREKIERVFQCKIFNRYGSREVGDIAGECQAHRDLHVFPWGNYVEILDEAGQPAPAGTEGNIVVTCLTNHAMPLIRYAIGDRGILSPRQSCSCGRTGQMIEKIVGRSVDTFKTNDGVLVDGEYFTHLLYFRDWVQQFQIIQKDPRRIVYRIVQGEADYGAQELDEICAKTKVIMGQDCQVNFEFTNEIQPSASGKYRYTISEV